MKVTIDDPDNVIELPVRKKDLGTERVLTAVAKTECWHQHGFIVDDSESEVTCKACGEKLNPIWALRQLANKEHRYHELHARYHLELRKLGERSRTKCEHCQKMTRISRS